MKSTQSHLFTTTHWYNTCLMEALVFAVSGQTELKKAIKKYRIHLILSIFAFTNSLFCDKEKVKIIIVLILSFEL